MFKEKIPILAKKKSQRKNNYNYRMQKTKVISNKKAGPYSGER